MRPKSHVLSGTGRKVEASKHLSWTFPPQQVPALIAKTMPTINAINYALHREMVCRGTWQCLSPQKSKKDRTQWNSSRGWSQSRLPLQSWVKYAPGQRSGRCCRVLPNSPRNHARLLPTSPKIPVESNLMLDPRIQILGSMKGHSPLHTVLGATGK